jgi:hypothetical protein
MLLVLFPVCFWDDERAASGADDVGAELVAAAEAGGGVAVRRRLGSCTYNESLAQFHTTLQLDWTLLHYTTITSNVTSEML